MLSAKNYLCLASRLYLCNIGKAEIFKRRDEDIEDGALLVT